MPRRTLGKQAFDELAQQLASRNAGPQSAKALGAPSDLPNESTTTPEPNLGTLLYLISLGVVAIATVVVFCGLGFFLLAHPNKEVTVDPGARDHGVEIEPRRPDPAAPPGLDASPSTVQTPARSVFPEKPRDAPDASPPARKGTTLGSASSADTVAANALDASSRQDQPELRSNTDEAAVAMPAGITDAKGTGIGRHRYAGARKQWARISQPGANSRPPPAISGPENAGPSRAVSHRWQERRSRHSDGSEAEVQRLNRAQLDDR
jgi:hypothetical protein